MRNKMLLVMSTAILTLSLCSLSQAETKTWTTDTDWKDGKMEKVEIVKQGEPSSVVLAACPELRIIDIDGEFSDWQGIAPLVTDTQDMVDADVDLKTGYIVNDEDKLYLRLDVYGHINTVGHWYVVYLDTDQNSSTGFTYGWWATGADYRILIDEYNIGLQEFMGQSQTEDTWGWNEQVYQLKNSDMQWSWDSAAGILEISVLRIDIGETQESEAVNILWRLSGDDSAPAYTSTVEYRYLK